MENKNEKIQILINELRENRNELKNMIRDLESLKTNLERLFPEKLDNRYRFLFEERLKVATSLFNSILSIRQEINKSINLEANLSLKIDEEEDDEIAGSRIRELAKAIEERISLPKVGGEERWKKRLKKATS